jgi:predicted Rdx family selenoprotein
MGNINHFRWTAPGVNGPPSVSLMSPADGANYLAPATIALSASASDSDGSITQVAFYAGTTLLATDTGTPYTFSWSSVPVGNYSLTAVATDNSGASTTSGAVIVHVVNPPSSTPFGGTPAAIPGLIEAENFDDGGEGIAYHDLTSVNSGGQYRQTGVDIETCSDVGGGYSLGYVAVGEWLKYTVSVAATASYTFEARVASPGTGGTFHVEIDGVDATGALAVPNTGGWQTWRSVLLGGIPLTAGSHVMRVVIDTNGPLGYFGNLNYFRWTPPGFNNPPSVSLTTPANGANYFAPASIALNANASDSDGSVTQVAFYAGTSLLATDTASPFTFTWNSVPLGDYSLTAVATDNAGATSTSAAVIVHVLPPPTSTPFGGTAASIPGLIEAENFDEGGEGVAYHDTTSANQGGQYRQTGVDIETCSDVGGGYSLGYVAASEWLKYSVSVATTGSYTVDVRVASPGPGGRFHVEVDGVDLTGPQTVPNTGGWQIWRSVTVSGISLTSGSHAMRVVIDANGSTGFFGNLNSLRWTLP